MIAEAVAQSGSNNLLFDWFDVALVAILGFGLYRGRRNGMSKELLPLLQWITIVLVCGLVYSMFGQLFINLLGLTKMWGYLTAYMTLLLLVLIVFAPIKRQFTDRLAMSDHFKGSEYYLGMLAGLVRFACMLMVALALLNAPVYTSADIANTAAYNARWFGGGVQGYSGNYFPTLQQVQEQVFKKSIGGSFIENGPLGILLINTVPPGTDKEKSSAMPLQKPPVIHIGN
jgi:uncharacterized membrane protein required for colicin V production